MRKHTTRILPALVLLALAATLAPAQEGYVRLGYTSRSGEDQSSALQKYEVIPDGDPSVAADLNFALGGNRSIELVIDRLFDGDERGHLRFRNGGFRAGLTYDRHQNWFSNTGRTLYFNAGGGVLLIDDAIQTAVEAAGAAGTMAPYASAATPIDLRYRREALVLDFVAPLAGDMFRLSGAYKSETRDGVKPIVFAMYRGTPLDQRMFEFGGPLDDEIRDARLGIEFANEKWYLATGAIVSKYTNDVNQYRFDNPTRITDGFAPTAGAATLQAATAPDNDAFTVDFHGGYRFGRHHRLSFAYAIGSMESNDPMLPFTLNTVTPAGAPVDYTPLAPFATVDAQIDTTSYLARFDGGFGKLGYELFYRGYELDNKTHHYHFDYSVRMDSSFSANPLENHVAGYEKQSYGAELHLDVFPWLRLGAGYVDDAWERPARRVAETGVTTLRGTADMRFGPRVSARVGYADISATEDVLGDPVAGEQPLARQYDIAERDTTVFDAHLLLTPVESFDIGLTYASTESEFPTTVYGATDITSDNYGVDFSYAASERLTFFAAYLNEQYDQDQASHYSTGTPVAGDEWFATVRDETDTYQLGLNFRATSRLDLGLDYTVSDGVSRTTCVFAPGGNVSGNCTFPTASTNPAFPVTVYAGWPDVVSDLSWFKARARYQFARNLGIGAELWQYEYDGEDWATDVMQVFMGDFDPVTAGVRFSTFVGAQVPDYDADIYRVYMDYTF